MTEPKTWNGKFHFFHSQNQGNSQKKFTFLLIMNSRKLLQGGK